MRGSKSLIFGMAYTKDISDVRESPSLELYKLLELQGAEMAYTIRTSSRLQKVRCNTAAFP